MTRAERMAAELVADAREWLLDCFSDCPTDLSDAEVVDAVGRHYHGGVRGFIADGMQWAADVAEVRGELVAVVR